MFKPLYWYHGNVKFPDTEVEKIISDLTKLGDHIKSVLEKSINAGYFRESSISSYYLDFKERPDQVWQPRYNEIVEEITKSIGIQSSTTYQWGFWTQLYFANDYHAAHTHHNGRDAISFVHFIEPTKENNFVFLDNDGNEHVIPEQNEGDIICFPSYIWHKVKPLKSGRRFAVAGNIEITYIEKDFPL